MNWDGQESLLMKVLSERVEVLTLYEAIADAPAADTRKLARSD
jgi:hypothetical protein